ncbi:protein-glutamate O-methyltransferase CheR [Mesobacillus maritimus]|uniref:CheR family methyltransferase n=1 Tax=Mesobacillus maritimus TaxID=1643336 RepID=UPI00203D263F|nr:protein-glutamate O-methyltransferase CheR [Mesobacillus maritimus]MCM3588662.1 protein-glutamate O-methyltransferase CheR [Mesobacillus maritimus]MCM3671815.1 protein-glutamate O-methyltransferase CheR [Mesobacillus maritimus]
MSDQNDDLERLEIQLLLEGIYQHYGFDFRKYSFSSIQRRIWHRIKTEKLKTITALLDKVLHDPIMMEKLYLDFSINVTEMFRDPSFFKAIRNEVFPLLRDLPNIRIWHAGCSTGEEAYSMAILLKEEGLYDKTRIYATDMNHHVIRQAKQGYFALKKMQGYTCNYVHAGGKNDFSEYYTVNNNYAVFREELSRNIIFAQHNLVTDGSFNEFHLIICRNVLIYFNHELQSRVHELFLNSLSSEGFLALGNREGLSFPKHEQYYDHFNCEEKIYRRTEGGQNGNG